VCALGKRPSHSYRVLKMPYTRKEFISRMQDVPEGLKHSSFGNTARLDFPAKISLVALVDGQVSARALAAVRVGLHRELRILNEKNYRLQLVAYPFHQARSHGLVGVAKAERISSGMGKGSFGAPEMRMARLHKGHALLEISMEDDAVSYGVAMRGLRMVSCKLPLKWQIKTEGFSPATLNVKVNLPKRVKEKKAATGGQQTADLQRETA
jgi:ribosomal protein L16/L10AE